MFSFRPDTSRIYVNVGLGFHLELTLTEAKKFTDKQVKELNDQLKESDERSTKIKANIKLVLESLRRLQTFQSSKDSS